MDTSGEIRTAHLYAPLHEQLILLLESLAPADWLKPTVCRGWAVRDIAAHILDGDIRRLSLTRDRLEIPTPDPPMRSYADLVGYLNRLNAEWVNVARRFSPRLLIDLLRFTGPQVAEHVNRLDPASPSRFSVAWAGEDVSANWFDVARDYTERWHHQQQIRDAVGAHPITDARLLSPVIETFMRALPYRYREVQANDGEAVLVSIEGGAGGQWVLVRTPANWHLEKGRHDNPGASLVLDQDTAWRHFTKGITREELERRVQVSGAAGLAEPFLTSLAVMA
jgi:uncharacterized protein (TIGR03083 family)